MVAPPTVTAVSNREVINDPRSKWIGSGRNCDVDLVLAAECRGRANTVEGEHYVKPTLRVLIEIATRIRYFRPVLTSGAVYGCRIAVKRVEIDDPGERIAFGVKNAQNIIDGLQDIAIAGTKTLVWGFHRELVASVGKALIAEVETVERQCQFGV